MARGGGCWALESAKRDDQLDFRAQLSAAAPINLREEEGPDQKMQIAVSGSTALLGVWAAAGLNFLGNGEPSKREEKKMKKRREGGGGRAWFYIRREVLLSGPRDPG